MSKSVIKTIAFALAGLLIVGALVAVVIVFSNKTDRPDYTQDGLVMKSEATIRLADPSGVRFTATISPELKKEVEEDENKSFGMAIAPISYFMKVDKGETYKETDWIKALEEESLNPLIVEGGSLAMKTTPDGTVIEHCINGAITSILYNNTNLQFLGIAFVKTVDGENVSYRYASFPEGVSYKDCSYSYAYLAAQCLNEYVLNNVYYSKSDLDLLEFIINKSVDLANGLSEEEMTDDDSKYTVTLSETEKNLKIDEEFTLKVTIKEGVKTPIWWRSSDSNVATVNNGVITAKNNGTATILVVVSGTIHRCTVTVGETVTGSNAEATV